MGIIQVPDEDGPSQRVKRKDSEVKITNNTYVGDNIQFERVRCSRGDIVYADFSPVVGSEQGGIRPGLVMSNDLNNKFSTTINVLPISAATKKRIPVHVVFDGESAGLDRESVILTEQCRVIDRARIMEVVGHLSNDLMKQVEHALLIQFGMDKYLNSK